MGRRRSSWPAAPVRFRAPLRASLRSRSPRGWSPAKPDRSPAARYRSASRSSSRSHPSRMRDDVGGRAIETGGDCVVEEVRETRRGSEALEGLVRMQRPQADVYERPDQEEGKPEDRQAGASEREQYGVGDVLRAAEKGRRAKRRFAAKKKIAAAAITARAPTSTSSLALCGLNRHLIMPTATMNRQRPPSLIAPSVNQRGRLAAGSAVSRRWLDSGIFASQNASACRQPHTDALVSPRRLHRDRPAEAARPGCRPDTRSKSGVTR